MTELRTGSRLSIFPLPGALLLPRGHLPLHIFEPRYRAMVSESLARDRRIAMIQPLPVQPAGIEKPALFAVGCVGKIIQVQAMEDGRYSLLLEGLSRFRTIREMDVATPFRQIEAGFDDFEGDADDLLALPSVVRADVEIEARRFADAKGYGVNWDEVDRLDDEAMVNGFAQAIPFDVATKQALLEAPDLAARAELLSQVLRLGAGGEDTVQ